MAVERTLSIIKPDAVAKNVIGRIISRFEQAGLKIVAARMMWLSRQQAEGFYAVHRERPFFRDLVEFMERSSTVFDNYLTASLLPRLAALQPEIIGISVTFLHQVFAAVRTARLIRDAFPRTPMVLGGALVECWNRADWTLSWAM